MREKLEEKKDREFYSSMSELVREALREYLKNSGELEHLSTKEEAILELAKEGRALDESDLPEEVEEKLRERLK